MPESAEMLKIFKQHIDIPISADPRSTSGTLFGFPFDVVRKSVLGLGLADYSQPYTHAEYGDLTADERTLLYCYVNHKAHFRIAWSLFNNCRPHMEPLIFNGPRAAVLDFGCGPATACLALSDVMRGQNFDYIGIDSAEPMRRKAQQLWDETKSAGLIGPESVATFRSSWSALAADFITKETPILLIFSFFFASHGLGPTAIQSLADLVRAFRDCPRTTKLILAYMNSTDDRAREKYLAFLKLIGRKPDPTIFPDGCEVDVHLLKATAQ